MSSNTAAMHSKTLCFEKRVDAPPALSHMTAILFTAFSSEGKVEVEGGAVKPTSRKIENFVLPGHHTRGARLAGVGVGGRVVTHSHARAWGEDGGTSQCRVVMKA